jgi:O-antigen ligase
MVMRPSVVPVKGLETDPALMSAARLVGLGVICLPFLVPAFPANLAPADIALMAAIVIFGVWAGWTRQPLAAPYFFPVWIIATTGALATLTTAFPSQGAVAVAQDVYLFVWSATVCNVVRRPAAMRVVLRAWALSSAVAAAVLVVAVLTRQWSIAGVGSGSSRAAFTFGEQNGASLYFVVSLMVVLATRCPSNRALRAGAVVLMVAAIVATGSLAGLLGLALGLGTAGVLIVRDRRGYPAAVATLVGLVLAGGMVLFASNNADFVNRVRLNPNVYIHNSIGREEQSKSEREVLARETSRLYESEGFLGYGPASTKYLLEAEQAPYPKEAHNDYLAALVERGPLGLLGVILLAGGIAMRGAAVSRPRNLVEEFRSVVPRPAFVIGALITVLIFSFTHESLHDRTVWTLLGLVGGMYAWARRPGAREVS